MYSSSALFWVIWNGDRNRTTTRGFGREAMWRQREVSPELPSDLPGETKKKEKREKGKTCPLRDLNLNFWMFGLLHSLVTAASVFPSNVLVLGESVTTAQKTHSSSRGTHSSTEQETANVTV